ncbi:helix-turn-helix domain-containing protein [Pseudarthrobacter sp. P1]|uniref:helix-turn-helix domain-containing protein n=1 Tax=Pseudarthrobacter sp. P1 TaxID=3418418 RepID=UPI003CE944BC
MRTTIGQNYSAYRRESCVVVADRRIYVLIHSANVPEARSIAARILRVVDRVVEGKAVGAIAQPSHHSGALVSRREEVADILQCHTVETADGVLLRDDVHVQLLVNRVQQVFANDPALAIHRFSDLVESEKNGKGNLCQTTLAWCQHLGNSLRTAQQLGIHDNTVRYRPQSFSKVVGVDLSDTDTVLAVWLQLRSMDANA